MSLADDLAAGIATLRETFSEGDWMADITVERWVSIDMYGAETYNAPETFKAIVDLRQQDRPGPNGQVTRTGAYIGILEPVPALVVADRVNPFDARDRVTLPDGHTGEILEIGGFVRGDTGLPFFSELWLGALSRSGR